jgi:hypothetical protein
MARGTEDLVGDKLVERFARELADDLAEQNVINVAINEPLARTGGGPVDERQTIPVS